MKSMTTWGSQRLLNLTSFREIEEVLRRGTEFLLAGTRPESGEFFHGTLVAIDGREHLDRRRALSRMLGPRQPWGPEGRLFDETFERNMARVRSNANDDIVRFDLIDFARRVNWQTTAVLIGLDGVEDDQQVTRFQELAMPLIGGLTVEHLSGDHAAMVADARRAMSEVRESMFQPSFERRKSLVRVAKGGSQGENGLIADLITSLIAASIAEPDVDLVFRECLALLAASVNNPVWQIAFAVDDLLDWLDRHPEDGARTQEKTFLNGAVKETLRLHRSARPYLVRRAVADVVLQSTGRTVKSGTWLALWLGQANQDPTVFGQDAHLYNPHRALADPTVQSFGIAFGGGPHACMGRPMLVWEQGAEDAQGTLTKMLRKLLSNGIRRDPDAKYELRGEEGGRRFMRYDILMPARGR
jgi:cytochrome P450